MHRMGIFIGYDLRRYSLQRLTQEFGKMGAVYYNFARGIDLRPVEAFSVRKSVGCEQTFMEDTDIPSKLIIELYHLVLELVERIKKAKFKGRTLTLKVKFHDFTQITRSITRSSDFCLKEDILPAAKALLKEVEYTNHPVRLLGLSVSHPHEEDSEKKTRWVEQEFPF